jgi:hypothetical protein
LLNVDFGEGAVGAGLEILSQGLVGLLGAFLLEDNINGLLGGQVLSCGGGGGSILNEGFTVCR